MKRIVSGIIIIAMILSLGTGVFAEEVCVISNVNQVWDLGEGAEPAIYKAVLRENGRSKDVYCVVCDGMDLESIDPNDSRSITNAVKIGLSCENNKYVKTVCEAILEKVPAGASLVLLGRSMGGMVIQQVMAQSAVKKKYEILNALAVGSPYICTFLSKEGTLRRCVDRLDVVPYLSIAGLSNPYIGNVSFETSGMIFPEVHFSGYSEAGCWKQYDCLGVKGGNATITILEKR